MPIPFLTDLDLSRNQLLNVVIHKASTAPASPVTGQLWYDTTLNQLNYYDGAWKPAASQAWVTALRLDQFASPTVAVTMNGQKVTNVADPTAAQDAATKAYVDSLINGTDWKQSVRVIATTNITLSGLQTIDGVSVASGDRVAVVGQTAAKDNGLYTAASGAWTRTPDADTSAKVTADLAFFVEEGSSYADTQWRLTTNNPITLGTTALAFAQIGAGSSYTAGNGIAIAGSVISLDSTIGVRKSSSNVGDGSATSIVVTHNLSNQFVQIVVIRNSDGRIVYPEVNADNANTCTINFNTAPTSNQYKIVVQG